jgi:hypothetical protein
LVVKRHLLAIGRIIAHIKKYVSSQSESCEVQTGLIPQKPNAFLFHAIDFDERIEDAVDEYPEELHRIFLHFLVHMKDFLISI